MQLFKYSFVAMALAVVATSASALTIRDGFDANTLLSNDDDSTGRVSVGFDLDFFGVVANEVYVNNNGNITLDGSLTTFTPFDLTSTGQQIIAPFFADVDTRSAGVQVTYGTGTVDDRSAFGVNWVDVGYFSGQADRTQLNDIQLILVDRSDIGAGNFDIEFNYGDILWETGNASNGANGLGGNSARAGFSNGSGDAGTSFELEGSAVNGAFLNGGSNELISGSNIDEAGRFLFTARNSMIVQPPIMAPAPVPTPAPIPSAVPLPAGGPLLLAGLAVFGLLRRKMSAA